MFKLPDVFERFSGLKLRSGMVSAYGVKPYVGLLNFADQICPNRNRINAALEPEREQPAANGWKQPTFGQCWQSKNAARADRSCA